MQIQNGTPTVIQLFDRLQSEGSLVDLYSKEFFDKNQDGPAFFLQPFEMIEEVERGISEDYGDNKFPLNHLLFLCVSLLSNEDKQLLISLYAPLKNILKDDIHHPNFLILNLYTKQILAVGLGRKNRLFCIDVASNKNIDLINLPEDSEGNNYIQNFTEHDVVDFFSDDLTGSLQTLSYAFFEQDHLPFINDLQDALESSPNEEGLYELDGYEDGVTAQDIKDMIKEYENHQESINQSLQILQSFFPELTEGDLNTGDY
ncbi:hypothetical protein [Polynucleobacter asymbioticus]|uniref:Uncharacterized protein n=1 Tax=Polynucleobacter asymbioticus (strain DSM 18221 / CIP 109841 / QLW-P1DMWA-1) TaxID=312153 RepID=A4T0K9_POLAQ|nr:hypothetical protein [Polynucleobacter asymbioticus]ABP35273.1 hypothetical protein Pnuc_2062 [Polynucleobacter asymbioticus QLW-P1DMWA-1]MBT8573793.1 hypothetical protein [Polynucleobacter paneuropaeus]